MQQGSTYRSLWVEVDPKCLPGEWPKLAEASGAAESECSKSHGIIAILDVFGGYLILRRPDNAVTTLYPFSARVPLRSIREIRLDALDRKSLFEKSHLLTFLLDGGDELRLHVKGNLQSLEQSVEGYREAVRRARSVASVAPTCTSPGSAE